MYAVLSDIVLASCGWFLGVVFFTVGTLNDLPHLFILSFFSISMDFRIVRILQFLTICLERSKSFFSVSSWYRNNRDDIHLVL